MKRTVRGGEPYWKDKHPNINVRDGISGDGYRFIPPGHMALHQPSPGEGRGFQHDGTMLEMSPFQGLVMVAALRR